MKPLSTSTYNFPDLIAGGYLYVDKTAQIYEWVKEYKGQYFLSRPRRFGKSLLVSTLVQIRGKGYSEAHRNDGRELLCVGVVFDPATRNLGKWLTEAG